MAADPVLRGTQKGDPTTLEELCRCGWRAAGQVEVAELMRRSPGAVRQLQRRPLLALPAALREESRP